MLVQIIKITSVGAAAYGDLKLIGEAPKCGVMLMPKKISTLKELVLINQSVTGLFESRIDLLTV